MSTKETQMVNVVVPVKTRIPPPPGAVRWATTWLDENGEPRKTNYAVPVDANDFRTPHRFHSCPHIDETKRMCDESAWLLPGDPSRYCPRHGAQLTPVDTSTAPRRLPWRRVWLAAKSPIGIPAAAGVATGIAGLATDLADIPVWALDPAVITLAAAAYATTKWTLTRRARKTGKLDPGDEIVGRRRRSTIARRARAASHYAALAGGWIILLNLVDTVPWTLPSAICWSALPALTAIASRPWRQYVADSLVVPAETAPQPVATPEEQDPDVDPVEQDALAIWGNRVGHSSGVLAGTKLTDFRYVKGGWAATITSTTPGSFDPDRFTQAVKRVASAYRVPLTDVTIEVNVGDVSTATLSMLRNNPLTETRLWPGADPTCDWDRGVSQMGWFGDDSPAWYRWWNAGGPWHDLISGCTGSGKSEFVQMLLLTELHSQGLILSRVIDPQAGQSFGELQDQVDWFAPAIAEAQLLLLDTVKEMRRRNRVYSRRRQKTWQPTREFPLIVITIDEAHEVLKDPICLALVEQLAKMARKCGIKLRIITQVPVVTEIGNSTPIKDALLAGNMVLFRTGSPISAQVALNGILDVDPHKLPPEWPDGSPSAGQTTAGLGYLIGTSRRSAALRTFYTGRPEDLPRWLADEDGEPIIDPGVSSPEMAAESGALWGKRRERVAAWFDAPSDDSEILPGDLVDVLLARASGAAVKSGASARKKPVEGGGAKQIVLRLGVQFADAQGNVEKNTLATHAKLAGQAMKGTTLNKAIDALIEEGHFARRKNGVYEVTDKAKAAVGAEREEMVETMLAEATGETRERVSVGVGSR